jgi:hypothetical protein
VLQLRVSFAVGYHHIHPDVSLNYQMNRFSNGGPDMLAEMRAVAPHILDYADYIREFLQLYEWLFAMQQLPGPRRRPQVDP